MTKICPNCGQINGDEQKFCGDCGSALTDSAEFTKPKEENKGYLVCDDCGGLYKLQEGESPSDFASCQCGGKLIHTYDLTTLKNNVNSVSKNKNHTSIDDYKGKILGKINKKALIIGSIITVVLSFIFTHYIMDWLMWKDVRFMYTLSFLISPLIVGLILYKKDYYTVAINGAIIGLIPFLFILIYNNIIIATFGPEDTIVSSILDLIFYPIVGAIFALIGGFILVKLKG